MLNSVAAGRRLALRATAFQLAAAALVALAFLFQGVTSAVAAGLGGLAVALGGLAASWIAFGKGVSPATGALGRVVAGMLLKWCVVVLVVALALAWLKLPALPLLAGLVTVTLVFVVTNSIQR